MKKNAMKIEFAEKMAAIDTKQMLETVNAIGTETIQAIATSADNTKIRLIEVKKKIVAGFFFFLRGKREGTGRGRGK